VVDSKAPLTAFLEAVAASDETERRTAMIRHSQQVAKHIEQLGSKNYWSQFQPAPEIVVLFLPGEHFLSAALEHKPSLIEDAARRKIIIATPSTLIAILKSVAFGWRQERLAQNAEEIRKLAGELFDRIVTVQSHFTEVGRSLRKSVESFNSCVGSLQSRLFPSLRKIRELGATSAEEPLDPEPIDVEPRELQLFES
jgi:DNA recombination protein RmuC